MQVFTSDSFSPRWIFQRGGVRISKGVKMEPVGRVHEIVYAKKLIGKETENQISRFELKNGKEGEK